MATRNELQAASLCLVLLNEQLEPIRSSIQRGEPGAAEALAKKLKQIRAMAALIAELTIELAKEGGPKE